MIARGWRDKERRRNGGELHEKWIGK